MLHRAARGIYMPCTMSTACSRQLAQTVMMLMATGTTKRVRGPDEDLASVPGLPHERADCAWETLMFSHAQSPSHVCKRSRGRPGIGT